MPATFFQGGTHQITITDHWSSAGAGDSGSRRRQASSPAPGASFDLHDLIQVMVIVDPASFSIFPFGSWGLQIPITTAEVGWLV